MKVFGLLTMFMLLCSFARSNIKGQCKQETKPPYPIEWNAMQGKVFRSDTNETISNAYLLLESATVAGRHFELRTDKDGNYCLTDIPVGEYTVSVFAWFRKMNDVPCQKSHDAKTADNGEVNVVWQRKSTAYMETVIIKDFSVKPGHEVVKDFDLVCR